MLPSPVLYAYHFGNQIGRLTNVDFITVTSLRLLTCLKDECLLKDWAYLGRYQHMQNHVCHFELRNREYNHLYKNNTKP